MDLLFQRRHLASQPIGSHADTDQAAPFKVTDSVGKGGHDWEYDKYGFINPASIILEESAYKGWEARFMVFTIETRFVPSLDRCFH
jgi:hypothetical protein